MSGRNRGNEIALRGMIGGSIGGAAIGGVTLMLGSLWSVGLVATLLATPLGAVVGGALGLIIGTLSASGLAAAGDRVVGHDLCARRLAFTTSAAPFLLLLVILPDLAWPLLAAAAVSGIAGAALAPWVVQVGTSGLPPWT